MTRRGRRASRIFKSSGTWGATAFTNCGPCASAGSRAGQSARAKARSKADSFPRVRCSGIPQSENHSQKRSNTGPRWTDRSERKARLEAVTSGTVCGIVTTKRPPERFSGVSKMSATVGMSDSGRFQKAFDRRRIVGADFFERPGAVYFDRAQGNSQAFGDFA